MKLLREHSDSPALSYVAVADDIVRLDFGMGEAANVAEANLWCCCFCCLEMSLCFMVL